MPESAVFDWFSQALEEATSWSSLASRGTVRLALKKAGVDPSVVNKTEMFAVIDRILVRELEVRGIQQAAEVCRGLRSRLQEESFAGLERTTRPEAVFRRVLGTDR